MKDQRSQSHRNERYLNAEDLQFSLTLAVGAGAKAEAEATRARVQAAVNFMVKIVSKSVM
jgi:hypothetical protein